MVHLAGLSKLRSLSVWNTSVGDEAVARLEKAIPGIEIAHGEFNIAPFFGKPSRR
jgi:hypothetical protein